MVQEEQEAIHLTLTYILLLLQLKYILVGTALYSLEVGGGAALKSHLLQSGAAIDVTLAPKWSNTKINCNTMLLKQNALHFSSWCV